MPRTYNRSTDYPFAHYAPTTNEIENARYAASHHLFRLPAPNAHAYSPISFPAVRLPQIFATTPIISSPATHVLTMLLSQTRPGKSATPHPSNFSRCRQQMHIATKNFVINSALCFTCLKIHQYRADLQFNLLRTHAPKTRSTTSVNTHPLPFSVTSIKHISIVTSFFTQKITWLFPDTPKKPNAGSTGLPSVHSKISGL